MKQKSLRSRLHRWLCAGHATGEEKPSQYTKGIPYLLKWGVVLVVKVLCFFFGGGGRFWGVLCIYVLFGGGVVDVLKGELCFCCLF